MGLPAEFLGTPFIPFIIIFAIFAFVALFVLELPQSSAPVCIGLAWVASQIYKFGAGSLHSANLSRASGSLTDAAAWVVGVLIAVIVLGLIGAGIYGLVTGPSGAPGGGYNQVPASQPVALPPGVQPSILWHGCKGLEVAKDILLNDRWIVGESQPPSVWLTSDFNYAATHAGMNGYVVQVRVNGVQLEHKGGSFYTAPIPYAVVKKQYYRIAGVRAIGVFDKNQARVL